MEYPLKDHGTFRLEMIDHIVHVYPEGGFNEYGIKKIHKTIENLVSGESVWALFEHPKNLAGLTPEALEEIIKSYQAYVRLGCVAIVLEASPTWIKVFESAVFTHLEILTLAGTDEVRLRRKLEAKITYVFEGE